MKRKLEVDSHKRTVLVQYISDGTKESESKALELIRSDIDLEQADGMGFTYLHFAAQFENPTIVKALLENGANANAETLLGASSLQLAVVRCKNYAPERSYEVIKLLLEAGADPDKKSRDGYSVRDLAKFSDRPEIEELVCNWGKRKMTQNDDGIEIKVYEPRHLARMIEVWNGIVAAGDAFPQEETLTAESGAAFFGSQTFCAVAESRGSHDVLGLYILHPNNVGRCAHICNASFAVSPEARGRGVGERLVRHCLAQAKECGFRVMQFNAVVADNIAARRLYERLGFVQLGTIPGGFRALDGGDRDICPYIRVL